MEWDSLVLGGLLVAMVMQKQSAATNGQYGWPNPYDYPGLPFRMLDWMPTQPVYVSLPTPDFQVSSMQLPILPPEIGRSAGKGNHS